MTQVIIYQNPNGSNVHVCYPTGELPIEEVLTKDCPSGAIIVDESTLPQGADAQFFDAWELSGSTVSVNFEKAKDIKLKQFNGFALAVANQRNLNDLAGIANITDDATWQTILSSARANIASATTTTELLAIANPQ